MMGYSEFTMAVQVLRTIARTEDDQELLTLVTEAEALLAGTPTTMQPYEIVMGIERARPRIR